MDRQTLIRLGKGGFKAVPANCLYDLSVWCRDWCEATGDGRYCILGETLLRLSDWWLENDESHGGIPVSLSSHIEYEIVAALPDIVGAADVAYGAQLAGELRQSILVLLLPINEWSIDQIC